MDRKDYLTQTQWITVFTREIAKRKWDAFEGKTKEQDYQIY